MVSMREEKAQDVLQATRERLAEQVGDLSFCWGRVGKLETDLAVLKKSSEARSQPAAPVSVGSEVVSSQVLTVSIAQMTIGAAPSLTASATMCQPTATFVPTAAAPPRPPAIPPVGVADTATTIVHSAAQLATGRPYAVHPPPPGFPYVMAGYSPIGECTPIPTLSMCRQCRPSL